MFGAGGGGGRALRRVGSSPRAPPRLQLLSKSDSIKKRSAKTKKGGVRVSKRARLRAGLAAALQELMLPGRQSRGRVSTAAAGAEVDGTCRVATAGACAASPSRPAAGPEEPASSGGTDTGGRTPPAVALLMLVLLALACVVALGRAPAVCCCICAAWWCRGPAACTGGRRRRSGVLSGSVKPQAGGGSNRGAAGHCSG